MNLTRKTDDARRTSSVQNKVKRLQSIMQKKHLAGIVLFRPQNTFYLTGFNPILYSHPVVVVLPVEGDPVLLVHSLRGDHAIEEAVTEDIRLFGAWGKQIPIAEDPYDALHLILGDLKLIGGHIGYEGDYLSVGKFEKIKNISRAKSMVDVGDVMRDARVVKDEYEIAMIRNAARMTDEGMKAAIDHIEKSEIEASIAAETAMRQMWNNEYSQYEVASFGGDEGGIVNSLWCYSNSGVRTTHGCDSPTSRVPQPGETALPIIWAACAGYYAENERTIIIKDLKDKYMKAYEAMLEANSRTKDIMKPGISIAEVYNYVVEAFREAGFSDNLPGRIGHGIGLGIHEYPSISPFTDLKLKKGMVLTVEPGLVFPEWGSVRHSDTVAITENGIEVLTVSPSPEKIIR